MSWVSYATARSHWSFSTLVPSYFNMPAQIWTRFYSGTQSIMNHTRAGQMLTLLRWVLSWKGEKFKVCVIPVLPLALLGETFLQLLVICGRKLSAFEVQNYGHRLKLQPIGWWLCHKVKAKSVWNAFWAWP